MTGAQTARTIIEVRDVSSGYGDTVLNSHMTFEIFEGEVFGILGGSGCGKSTLLKNMIGLLDPLAGELLIYGKNMARATGREWRALQKRFGVMYQQGALFGSMTLLENVCLPLQEHTGLRKGPRERVASTKLALVSLAGYEHFYPDEISGGMRKRAAIARALALDPKIIFLDEPSAGLDPITSAELDELIRSLARILGITFVMVTHELASIFAVVDRAIMLDQDAGGIVAIGNPTDLRNDSTHPFVRRFFHRQTREEGVDAPAPEEGVP